MFQMFNFGDMRAALPSAPPLAPEVTITACLLPKAILIVRYALVDLSFMRSGFGDHCFVSLVSFENSKVTIHKKRYLFVR